MIIISNIINNNKSKPTVFFPPVWKRDINQRAYCFLLVDVSRDCIDLTLLANEKKYNEKEAYQRLELAKQEGKHVRFYNYIRGKYIVYNLNSAAL